MLTNEELQEYGRLLVLKMQSTTVTVPVGQLHFLSDEQLGMFVRHLAKVQTSYEVNFDVLLGDVAIEEIAKLRDVLLNLDAGGVLTVPDNLRLRLSGHSGRLKSKAHAEDALDALGMEKLRTEFPYSDVDKELSIAAHWYEGKSIFFGFKAARSWLSKRVEHKTVEQLKTVPMFCVFCNGTKKVMAASETGIAIEADCIYCLQDEQAAKEESRERRLDLAEQAELEREQHARQLALEEAARMPFDPPYYPSGNVVEFPVSGAQGTGFVPSKPPATSDSISPASDSISPVSTSSLLAGSDGDDWSDWSNVRNGLKTGDDVLALRVKERYAETERLVPLPTANVDPNKSGYFAEQRNEMDSFTAGLGTEEW